MISVLEPCPNEMFDVSPDVQAVSDSETLALIVILREHVLWQNDLPVRMATTAIRQDDLKGNERSVSVMRLEITPQEQIEKRAKALNQEAAWASDPISALAGTASLRQIFDNKPRREVCVYAEPTSDDNDKLGECLTHAGIKRSSPLPTSKDKLAWAVLRATVAERFKNFRHVCSGTIVGTGLPNAPTPLEPPSGPPKTPPADKPQPPR